MTDDITKAIERAKELDRTLSKDWKFAPCPKHADRNDLSCFRLRDRDGQPVSEIALRFAAESRTLLPQLVAEVERLQERCARDDAGVTIHECPPKVKRAEKAEASRTMPEWRPLSVLTQEIVDKHPHWALRLAWSGDVIIRRVIVANAPAGDGEATHCRPVDRDGVPVPWSEVGL